ncbi:uncharacterized protein A1O5_06432 [Cladophialophora psammophila CBS 110553]|uniref:Uncharacterized protein n=1 Tax=Cladophialophora psammophila CBS 110553 TaxID=1182543 RepID=W9XJ37_9EURO|nr:uncharacterized protein A1O5_06432 [Cladophialophora psammophila CBS 110553]EXJ70364.1 hypothetical protein A1O5_06432 [Cladophialophora psammophila CBS 110553]
MTPSNGEHLTFEFAEGNITKAISEGEEAPLQKYYTVFSAPPSQWWTDVRFACGGIQICTSELEAQNFHAKHGLHYGDVISLDKLWELSKAWYSDKATYDYERKTPQEAKKLFEDLGLDLRYWIS